MQYVAGEMQKDDHFRIKKIPLLIGGATTSRVHTAVKIAPHYEGPVVYVPDASRSVSVAQCAAVRPGREVHRRGQRRLRQGAPPARQQEAGADVAAGQGARQQDADRLGRLPPPEPKFIGRRVFKNFDLTELAKYIDWGPFFQTWDLAGPVPRHPEGRSGRHRGGARLCRRPAHAQAPDRRPLAHGQRRDRLLARQHRERRRHRALHRRVARAGGADLVRPAPADREAGDRRRDAPEPLPGRLRRAARAWPRTTWACSPSPPASASRRRRSTSSTTWTTTPPSCSRRWPTAWPRPLPKRCTSACARTCGATRRRSR